MIVNLLLSDFRKSSMAIMLCTWNVTLAFDLIYNMFSFLHLVVD
jgi:hypothetical protein